MPSTIFEPIGSTVTRTVTTSSARVALTDPGKFGSKFQVRVVNAGSYKAFITPGTSTVTSAVATGMPVLAGNVEVFTVNGGVTDIAAICDTGESTTLYITSGYGE
jgi:hypothetical protein